EEARGDDRVAGRGAVDARADEVARLQRRIGVALMTAVERTAASFGGAGFLERKRSHAEDLVSGVWTPSGVVNEFAPLREVLLAIPGDEVEVEDPDAALML